MYCLEREDKVKINCLENVRKNQYYLSRLHYSNLKMTIITVAERSTVGKRLSKH